MTYQFPFYCNSNYIWTLQQHLQHQNHVLTTCACVSITNTPVFVTHITYRHTLHTSSLLWNAKENAELAFCVHHTLYFSVEHEVLFRSPGTGLSHNFTALRGWADNPASNPLSLPFSGLFNGSCSPWLKSHVFLLFSFGIWANKAIHEFYRPAVMAMWQRCVYWAICWEHVWPWHLTPTCSTLKFCSHARRITLFLEDLFFTYHECNSCQEATFLFGLLKTLGNLKWI